MTRRFLTFALVVLLVASCKTGADKSPADATTAVEVSLDELMASPEKYVDQLVCFTGLVDHVCRHGGKKMFLLGENPENRIRLNTGDDMASFDVALEGTRLTVTGLFNELRIDEDYLTRWETELASGSREQAEEMKVHTGEGQGAESEAGETTSHGETAMGEQADQGQHIADLEQIKKYREMLAEQNTDHLSFYSVLCKEYKAKEE